MNRVLMTPRCKMKNISTTISSSCIMLQVCMEIRYNPPYHVAEALAGIYPHNKYIRILDCASGTGLVAERVGILVVIPGLGRNS